MSPDFTAEIAAGVWPVAGVDEVGRGPLAGPVVAAAVILDPDHIPAGLRDSKLTTVRERARLADEIRATAQVGVGEASVTEIDALNILQASHLAMCRAIAALPLTPAFCLIDGNLIPRALAIPARAIIRGDALSLSIAAASIMAKIWRDDIMATLALGHPGYGWEENAGYPTKRHKNAIQSLGVTHIIGVRSSPSTISCIKKNL